MGDRRGDQDREETPQSAYRRFEDRGGGHGDNQADWYAAEQDVSDARAQAAA